MVTLVSGQESIHLKQHWQICLVLLKGLGRNFLRHLRRTQLLVHVVDAAAADPLTDYRTVREELRIYDADYLERPYMVVLNKIYIPEARDRLASLTQEISAIGRDEMQSELLSSSGDATECLSTVDENGKVLADSDEDGRLKKLRNAHDLLLLLVSAVCINIIEMLKEIRAASRKCLDSDEMPKPGKKA